MATNGCGDLRRVFGFPSEAKEEPKNMAQIPCCTKCRSGAEAVCATGDVIPAPVATKCRSEAKVFRRNGSQLYAGRDFYH